MSQSDPKLPAPSYPGELNFARDEREFRFRYAADNTIISGLLATAHATRRDGLIVAFNGAVERNPQKDPRLVFQRRTWTDELEFPVLFLADPTIQPSNEIQIGWMQGTPFRRPIAAISRCIKEVRDQLGLKNSDLLLFGSSAGGFQAVRTHAEFPGSRFLVNNAQFDWSKYYVKYVDQLRQYSYPGLTMNQIKERYPNEVNVLENFVAPSSIISGEYMVNSASKIDYVQQLPVVQKFLASVSARPIKALDFRVSYYYDPKSKHMPRTKAYTLSKLNRSVKFDG